MKSLVLAMALAIPSVSFADSFCEGGRARSAAEQLASLELNAELNIVDLDLFKGGAAVAGYEYGVEPAYTNGLYARTDLWKIGTDLVPQTAEELTSEFTATLGLGAKYHAEASFVRFFTNACRAEGAKPYSPRRIPLKTDKALSDKFKVGDYFIFKSKLGFVASLDMLQVLGTPNWAVSGNISYLVEGTYQVHLVRQDEKHIRLKVVARRGKEGSLGLGLGWSGSFDVFGVSLLDRELKRQVNPKPLKVSVAKGSAQVFLVDYVLDLTDPAVSDAYDKVVRKMLAYENIRLAGPFRDESTLQSELILDLAPLEDLYKADYANNNVSRLKRNLRTSSGQDSRSFALDFGNKILGFTYDATASASHMTIRAADDSVERYLLKSYDRTFDGHFAWSFSRLYNKRSVEVLLKADEAFSDLDALNIVQTLEKKDKKLTKSEFDEIRTSLKKSLPLEIYSKIPFSQWTQKRGETVRNFGMRFQIVLGPDVVFNTPSMSAQELKRLYQDYIKEKGFEASDFYTNGAGDNSESDAERMFESSLNTISKKLATTIDTNVPDLERLESFMDLRSNTLFSQTGIGFLMALPTASTNYRLDLNLSGNKQSIDFSRGDESIAKFYRQLLTIKAALEDDGLDLRREAESITLN